LDILRRSLFRPNIEMVWWRQEPEPALDRETVDGMIRMLMAINAKIDRLLDEEDGDAEEDGP
jgi:hypothetical protein